MKHAIVKSSPDWAALNEKWINSGLPQKEFCRNHGVPYKAFLKERRHYIQTSASAINEPASGFAEFIPVSVEAPSRAATPEIVVELPMGVTIRFRGMQAS
jgi:hypothetical protein